MRPINLIPAEQRRGASRGRGGRSSFSGYIVLGVLGAAVLCMFAVVMTSNSINSKTEELAKIQGDSQHEKEVADALRPYGQFADLQRARMTQIETLAASRYNWERPLRQLSQAIPRNVWLLNVAATENPSVQVADGGGGGDIANLREKNPSPAFAISGCTYSQHAVARMMTRMRNLDEVTQVHLAKSARKEATASSGTAITADQGAGQGDQEIQDCTGSERVTKFDILVVFGGQDAASAAAATPAGLPSAAATPTDKANTAVAQSNGASASAGGTAP